eukprot:6207500-Pleurochrysis_carterae.AAC.4
MVLGHLDTKNHSTVTRPHTKSSKLPLQPGLCGRFQLHALVANILKLKLNVLGHLDTRKYNTQPQIA